MDRIDIQASKGISGSLRSGVTTPVTHTQAPRPIEARANGADDPPVISLASAGAEPPMDQDRVAQIRKAIEQGRYPVVPARIADAMIAAGYLLRTR
jgi:negative regulator of flagellin synthesis FlgM